MKNHNSRSDGLLASVNSPADIKEFNTKQLTALADEIRSFIINSVAKTGGHLSASLGTVELTIALHRTFNTPTDKLIWDVGHQCYAHKILTGRREAFSSLRQFGGISGFPKINESPYDAYNVGHSSTSLSLAIGEAVSRDIKGEDYRVIAVIGDGSLTGGMAFEALDQIGHTKHDLIIILNDNEHSISKNVGAMSAYLTKLISGRTYNRFRNYSQGLIRRIPKYGDAIYDFVYKVVGGFKSLFMLNNLFRDLGIRYFGPIDGHNLESLCDTFERVKHVNAGPKIIHVITRKGKGYPHAEADPTAFHGVGPFDAETGKSLAPAKGMSYSSIAGSTLARLSQKDHRLMAVTAAMKQGTGLVEFEKFAPDRFFDVGIAEQHAITFAAALAKNGMRPFVSIYSTFLQRATDQLIHDVGIMNLPVRILIDRAGIVGEDGETHHGLFDIAIIKNIPNFIFLAPANGEELRDMIHFAAGYDAGPVAIRFPKGKSGGDCFDFLAAEPFSLGQIKRISSGGDLAILALGDMVRTAEDIAKYLAREGVETSVINIRSIKPLDVSGIEQAIEKAEYFITLENGVASGGIGEHIMAVIRPELCTKNLFIGAFPDEFIPHGVNAQLFHKYGLDAESLSKRLSALLAKHGTHTA